MFCISFVFLCNKLPQAQQLKTVPMYWLVVLWVRSLAWRDQVFCSGYHTAQIKVWAVLSSSLLAPGKRLLPSSFLLLAECSSPQW